MVIRKQTHALLQEVVDALNITFEGLVITDLTGGIYNITTCNTMWLTVGESITIDSVVYLITELVPNVSITISGLSLPVLTEFTIYRPKFFYGTMMFTNKILTALDNGSDKLPMVYLHQVYTEAYNDDPLLNLGMTAQVDLYFMCLADFTNYTIKDHNKYCIIPMRNLVFSLIDTLKTFTGIETELYEYILTDLIKWGSYFDPKGNEKKYFSDDVSGCKLEIAIPFSKENICTC